MAIEANLAKTKLAQQASVHCLPVERWLAQGQSASDDKTCYDLILADPPYGLEHQDELLAELALLPLVGEETALVLEHSSRRMPPPVLGRLHSQKTRIHGDSAFTVYLARA